MELSPAGADRQERKGERCMKRAVTFHVPGRPQGKARARTFYSPAAGKSISVTPDKTVLYENLIKGQYIQAAEGMYMESGTSVALRIVARFLPPKSKSKKVQSQMLEGKILPLKKPDMDNIVKVVADALNGVAYRDDTQIVLVVAKKAYSAMEGLDITVEEYISEG